MPNMSLVKHSMPEQDPAVRATNFQEVALGYTREIAMEEADRCLKCKNSPCVSGCPVNVPIPDFIAKIREGDPAGPLPITAAFFPQGSFFTICAVPSAMAVSAANLSSLPIATGSPLIPRTHLLSHWLSCGHTRPQIAGSAFWLRRI